LGRRRRRVIRIVKKKLPTVFVCPKCGEETVRVTIAKDTAKATVLCASGQCDFKDEFPAHPAAQMIDLYSYAADRFYGVKDPRPIMPKEREAETAAEEAPEEPAAPETAIVESPEQPPMLIPSEDEPIVPVSPPEAGVSAEPMEESNQLSGEIVSASSEGTPEEASSSTEEEAEPFADILQNKDKKRYSPNPLPQEQSE